MAVALEVVLVLEEEQERVGVLLVMAVVQETGQVEVLEVLVEMARMASDMQSQI